MAIDLCNRLIDNNLSKDDLLKRVVITKTRPEDIDEICKTLSKAFDMNSELEAYEQMRNSKVKIDESVKLVDKENGDIYGLLMFCEYPIAVGSPICMVNKGVAGYLSRFTQINGHSFVIDERLRGTKIDKKMLFYNFDFLLKNYDFIWIAVETDLKTHNYWQRLGFVEVFRIPEAVFYMMPLNKKLFN